MIKTEEEKSEKKSRMRFHNMRRLNKHISWLLRDGMLIDRGYILAFRVVFSAAHLTASLSRVLRESYCDGSYSWLKAQDSVNMPQTGLESRPRLPILISVRQQLSHVFRCQVCGCIIFFFLESLSLFCSSLFNVWPDMALTWGHSPPRERWEYLVGRGAF